MAWVETKNTSWTPTVTQNGSVTVTVNNATYSRIGDVIITRVKLTVTGSGSAGSAIVIGGQPSAIQAASNASLMPIGSFIIEDSSASIRYVGTIRTQAATDWRFQTSGVLNATGVTPSFGLDSGDIISFVATYQV